MNKIFKVVWSKTKECYVVVSEVAKNNGGKKKVLASVLATLAIMGAGAQMGSPVHANVDLSKSSVNISPDNIPASQKNTVGQNSVVVGYGNTTDGADGKFILGANSTAKGEGAIAIGNQNTAIGANAYAIGSGANANGAVALAIGNKAIANSYGAAVGSGAEATAESSLALGRRAKASATSAISVGLDSKAQGQDSIAIGNGAGGTSGATGDSIAIGRASTTNSVNTVTIGAQSKATGGYAVAVGREAEVNANYANAVGYKAKAKASGALSLGSNTIANGTSATAVGTGAKVGDDTNAYEGGVAVGRNASAQAEHAAAVGNGAVATGKSSIASGDGANASAENAAAYGAGAQATNKQATAVGNASVASGENASAFGYNNIVTGDNSTALGRGNVIDRRDPLSTVAGAVAVGNQNKASGDRAIAIGETNTSKFEDTITMGANNTANTGGGIAIGKGNTADSTAGGGSNSTNSQVAIGRDNQAKNEDTIAIGRENTADKRLAMAIGNRTEATGIGAVAIGSNGAGQKSISSGSFSVALGTGTNSTGAASTALGGKSQATADSATAVGHEANASAKSATALGYKAAASIKDGVALGSESKTTVDAGQVGYNPAAGRTNKYDNLTDNTNNVLTSNRAAIAIGDDDAHITRQLTGLAAGTKDTDAVNVAQLRAVNLKYAGNSGNSDVRLENGTLNIKGEGLLSTSADATGITVKLTKGDDIANDNGKAKEPTNNGVATTQNVVQAINNSYWKATAGGNTDGTPAVGNVKPGTQVTYSAGDNLKVKQTINNTTGDQEYKYSLNPVLTGITSIANTATGPKITFGGNSINITGGSLDMGTNKITNLAPGTADNDAVNVKQLKDTELHITPGTYTPDANKKVKLTYTDGNNTVVTGKEAVIDLSGLATGGTTSTEKVKKAADATGDKNIAEVGPKSGDTFGAANATYEVSVSRNAVKDAAREAVTINNGGTKSGTTYTPNADNPITVTPKEDAANHNTTYEVTFDGNKAAKQIPLTYKATNNGTTTAAQTVKLDKGLNFTGGDYTTASVGADGKVTFDVNLGTAPTVTDGKPGVPGQAGAAGKDGIATVKTVVDTINNSGWKANAKANGGTLDGSSTATVVKPGDQVNFAAGKNLTVKQDLTGEHTYTYSLNKDLKDLTSVEIGGSTIKTDGDHITITSPDTNPGAAPGATVTNKVANLGDEKHIKPDTYAVANDGSVTLKYVDGNGKDLTETTKITGIAKKAKVINGKNTTVEEGTDTSDNSVTYKVNVKGDLAGISSITNGTGSGKISFEGDQVVKVGGDHPISFDGKGGYVTGLQNKDWDITNPTVVSGRAATEDQLKKVSDGFNNTVKLTGNSGATGTQKLNQNGGLSFGVVGADNGKYITTTASGSNVVADLSTDAKAKLNSKVVVAGSGAATVAAPTVTTNADGSTVTTYTVHVDPATATAASTESVVKKAVTGDTNIADVSVADGKATGDVGAKYEVSVSRNAVKDAAREAVTVNNGGTKSGTTYTPNADNPITVTPKEDAANHNTTYEVTFDGNKAAKQIPLTYKATNNGTTTAAQTVKLDKGLNFTGGDYTTASVGADGKVTFDVNLGTAPTVTDGKPGVPGQAGAAGKDGIATVKTVVDTINNSGWKANAKANGGNLDGSATATVVKPGNTVNYAAGKNLIVNQELEKDASNALTGNQTYTYSLNKDIDLTNAGSLTVGDTTVNNGGITIKAPTPAAGTTATTTDVKLTNTGLDNGGNKIVNVKDGDVSATSKDAVNGSQLHAVAAKERHIAPTTASHAAYTVDNNGDVTLDYVDGDGAATSEKAIIKGVAKQDLSNITNAGKQVITGLSNKVVAGDNITVDETEDTTTKQKTYKVNAKLAKLEDGTNTTVTGDGTTGNAYHVNVAGDLTGISSITNGGTNNGKISFGPNKTVTVDGDHSITLNASTGTIGGLQNKTFDPTNITSGQAATEDQLKSVHDTLKTNELHIAPTETNRTGEYTAGGVTGNTAAGAANKAYKYDATTKQVVLEYNDGTGANKTGTKAVIDFSALNTGAGASSWNIASDKVSTTEGTVAAGSAATQNIADGKTVTMKAGKNLTVKQENVGGNASVAFSLDKDLTNLDKVVVNGENGTNGKDGVTIIGPQGATGATGMPGTNGIDGKVGITGKDGKDAVSIAGKDGVGTIGLTGPQGPAGTNGKSVDISTENGTQTLVKPEANNNNQSQRIVYVPKDANGNPLKDDAGNTIKREVATMDDGLKFTGNNTVIENKRKLGSLVKVQGEGTKEGTTVINPTTGEKELVLSDGTTKFESAKDNIAVVADGADTLTVKLNKKLKGLDSVQTKTVELGDHTTPGGTTNITYNTGDNRIEYTTPGATPGTTGTKKVATTDDIWTIQGNGTDVKPVNGKVNVKAGDNVVITTPTTADGSMTINAVSPVVYTTPAGDKLTKKSDGKFYKADGSEYTGGDIIASFENPNANSIPAGKLNTTDGGMIVNNVGSAIKGLGSTGDNYLTKLDLANTATPNAAVNVSDLKNTADALKSNELHIRPTTSGRTGETVNQGAAGTAESYKYDATTKSVTLKYNDGTGAGVTGTEAKIDLSGLADQITSGYTFSTNAKGNLADGTTATATAVGNGKTVSFAAGKNLTVEQNIDATTGEHTYTYALSDKITAGKDGVNGKDGSVGVTGKDGSSVVINGADGSIGMTGPKGQDGKDGINGRDGANLSMTSAKGEQVLVNRDPAHNTDTDKAERIVYVPKDASGNPIQDANGKNIVREVATMDDGLKFTGNNTSTENKRKLGSLLKVQGEDVSAADEAAFQSAGGNIAVTANGSDTLTIRLNKNLKGLNSIQLGGNTIQSNGDNITFTTNGGTTKTVATTDQLWTIQANGTDVPAKDGKVNIKAGDHISITSNPTNGEMTISATGFGSMDGFNVKTSAESATVGTHAGDTTENIKNGKTVDMQAGKNLVVTQTNDGNGNTTVNYALNKDVDLGTNGSLKTGDTTINNDGFKNGNTTVGGNGMTIKNPTDPTKTVSLTKDGLNNGGNQITNVASGGNVDTNAANIGDIKRLAKDTRIKDGTYTVDNNGTVELTYVDGAGNQVKDASGNAITAKITGLTTLDSTRVNVAVNETGSGKAVGSTTPVKVTKGTEFVAGNNLIVERKAHTGNDLDNSVVYSLNSNLTGINSISNTAAGPKMTFGGNNVNFTGGDVKISDGNLNMNNNKITNVANGTDPHDAVNVSQLKAAKTVVQDDGVTTKVTKSTGANGEDVYTVKSLTGGGADLSNITNKVDQLGEEIGRVGAQGAALSALKPIQYDPLEPTQIMAGYGNYRGNSAVALGVAHYKNESTLIHGGVSWAGGSSHMMANAGVTWKVGNRDSEAAVADRYRKGPISSAYAMQQEMAAMKAQNAGLKGEVSDLKAENEQMKAQIAAMMAKLGL